VSYIFNLRLYRDCHLEVINYSNIAGTETYDSFNTFAIKIVGMAGNSAKVPTIDDFRAIAVF